MRKKSLLHKAILLSLGTSLIFGGSCKKDNGPDSKELLIYVQGDYGSTNNSIVASLTQTPLAVWGNTSFQVSAWSTRPVVADVNVYISADSGSVGQFNQANNKKCLLLPAGAYQIESGTHKIATGQLTSDPLQIKIIDPALLTDTNGYVLPLTVKKIEGKDRGVSISTNRATAYLFVPYAFTNIDTTQAPLTGTLMDRSAWGLTVSNTTNGAPGSAMLDGSNTTAWRSSNTAAAAKYAIVNLGSQQTIKGFQLVPDYVTTTENATVMTISSSTDSVTWTVQGIWKGTGPAAGSNAASPDIKGVNFIAPVQAKFFRVDITAWVSGNRTGIGELNALQ